MNTALKLVAQPLEIAVLTADPERRAALEHFMRDLGHAVTSVERAALILAEGVAPDPRKPSVVLGGDSDSSLGRLPRDASREQIDAALRAVAAGLSVTVAEPKVRAFEALPESESPALLTPREIEVLSAVARGLTNKEIARALEISQHTVKFHLESLLRKLGASSRAEAVSKTMRLNLLEPYRL